MLRSRRYLKNENSPKTPRDFWDKADILAKFLSSVVIAVIGILITWSIQHTQIDTNRAIAQAQLDAAKVKAQDERRFQESQVTVQLVNHLISSNSVQKQIAIVALRQSVPAQVYDSIIQVLARTDENEAVRTVAIKQLAISKSPQISQTLTAIATDPNRNQSERRLAAKANEQVVLTSGNEPFTYAFLSNTPGEFTYEDDKMGGYFTYAVIEGLSGKADFSGQGFITAGSLADFVKQRVASISSGKQNPVFSSTGAADTVLFSKKKDSISTKVVAIVIGISKYPDSVLSLRYAASDANAMASALRNYGADVRVLIDYRATQRAINEALTAAIRNTTKNSALVFYFAGQSAKSSKGTVGGWLASDSSPTEPSTWITFENLKNTLSRSPANSRWLFIDSCQ